MALRGIQNPFHGNDSLITQSQGDAQRTSAEINPFADDHAPASQRESVSSSSRLVDVEHSDPFADGSSSPRPSVTSQAAGHHVPLKDYLSSPGGSVHGPRPDPHLRSLGMRPRTHTLNLIYLKPSDLPPEAFNLLAEAIGKDVNARELFDRLDRTKRVADAYAHGEPIPEDIFSGEGLPKPPSIQKKAGQGIRKFFANMGLGEVDASGNNSSGSSQDIRPITDPSELPPPPPGIPEDDLIGLAIHYHESGNLQVSAYYLEQSAKQGHPLGCYLRAMALRHGWGVPEDKQHAFRALLQAAEMTMLTIPEVSQRKRNRENQYPSSKVETSTLGRTPTAIRNMTSYAGLAQLLPEDLQVSVSLLSLPLFEIGVCFQQGWGVKKSPQAALYYFTVAAKLGDSDAMYEAGYVHLHNATGTSSQVKASKMQAAQFLREADKAGEKVVGESWIWKKKWGGDEED